MSGKLSRWLRSKTGTGTIISVVAVLLVVAIIGQLLGWWTDLIDLITGAAVPPSPPTYPAPRGGYTCLPSCADGVGDYNGDGTPDPQDGRFLSMPGEQMASFGGASIIVWLSVPAQYTTFELGIFDGDSGKDNNGNVGGMWVGNWDETTTETTYALYTDPLRDGPTDGEIEVGRWYGNRANATGGTYCTTSSPSMPNNAWYTITCNNVPEARGPAGHYFYRLELTRPASRWGINALKLRSTGYLSTGGSDLVDASFAIVGMIANPNDIPIIFPQFSGDRNNPGPSNYTGDWQFALYVPKAQGNLEFWDGDFDRGTTQTGPAADTDDPNTTGVPSWPSPGAVPERAGGRGAPQDDYPWPIWGVQPPVWYEIIDPSGVPIHTNDNPSGTEEWEVFIVSTDPNAVANGTADFYTEQLGPGWYGWHIAGLDAHNTVWIRTHFEMVPICVDDPCEPPPPCDAECPRTIGYWKNNVRKVLIEGRTNGVQETQASIEAALRLIAQYSPLYRHGINVQNPVAIADPVPLTAQEADMILQRDKRTYPGGKDAANSMLARALQQNLATWLNMMSGKICKDLTVVTINVPSGTFQGTLWEALQEAQTIILNRDTARMERAKDIADLINNAQVNTDPADALPCSAYTNVVPPDRQPPPFDELVEAPLPSPPPPSIPSCPEGEVCAECTGNPCDSIFSPGYWKNYSNHYTDAEFLALIQKTMHYSGLTIDQALAILNNNADQYHRHLLSAELNVALNPGLGVGTYNSGSIGGQLVLQVLDMAYSTDPANADADLKDAVLYLGAGGEGQGAGACRVTCSAP